MAPALLLTWGHVLLIDLVALSTKYPHVSGFYKLVRIVTSVLDECGYFDAAGATEGGEGAAGAPAAGGGGSGASGGGADGGGAHGGGADGGGEERARCYALLCSFLLSLLDRCRRFSDELLASSLELLLCSPLRFLRSHLAHLSPSVSLSLTMGHAYPPLAAAALTCLERMQAAFPTALQPVLPTLLPKLHAYLATSSETSAKAGRLRRERDARRHRSAASSATLHHSAASR